MSSGSIDMHGDVDRQSVMAYRGGIVVESGDWL
jgi:formylmethanofuran dehydrogenase subunit C